MTYKEGDTVFATFGKYSSIDVRKGTVLAVSPTGVVRAQFEGMRAPISFNRDGGLRGEKWSRTRLIDQAEYDRLARAQARQQIEGKAANAIAALAAIRCTADNRAQWRKALEAVNRTLADV